MPGTSIIDEFRRRIRDVRYSSKAMGLAVEGDETSSALLEITNGRLIVNVSNNPGVPSLDINLSSSQYDTIGKLHMALSRTRGYRATIDEDVNRDHLSSDLEPMSLMNIVGMGIDLKHRLFSDVELYDMLNQAVMRHNPSFTLETLPEQEKPFVFLLAHAQTCREQAYDVSKRKGMDTATADLVMLADSYEGTYKSDVARLSRALQSPRESRSSAIGEGDVIIGQLFRTSLRTGVSASAGQNLSPDAIEPLNPTNFDTEDESVRINWERNRTSDFYSYELWFDTSSEVYRGGSGGASYQADYARATTARSVDIPGRFSSNTQTLVVECLEPDTDYYFRMFVIDTTGDVVASEVVMAHTKPLRTRFATLSPVVPTQGIPGTTVRLYFDNRYGVFTKDHVIKIEGKITPVTAFSDFNATIAIPEFFRRNEWKNITVTSPGGLTDIINRGIMVTL